MTTPRNLADSRRQEMVFLTDVTDGSNGRKKGHWEYTGWNGLRPASGSSCTYRADSADDGVK